MAFVILLHQIGKRNNMKTKKFIVMAYCPEQIPFKQIFAVTLSELKKIIKQVDNKIEKIWKIKENNETEEVKLEDIVKI